MSVRTPAPSVPENLHFTPRQREVLDLLVRRYSNAEIAEALGVSLDGAKWHVREIMSILGVETREDAAEFWRQYNGLPARLRRLAALPSVPAAVRWILAGAAVAAALVGGIVLASSLRDSDDTLPADDQPSPTLALTDTPEATRTPAPSATPDVPRAVPTPVPAAYPLGTRTGDTVIDRIIEAVEGQDWDAMAAMLQSRPAPCTLDEGQYWAPRCPPGDPEGTPVETFFGMGCEGAWMPIEQARSWQHVPFIEDQYRLHAVSLDGPTWGGGNGFPLMEPEAWVVLTRTATTPPDGVARPGAISIGADAAGPIAFRFSCHWSGAQPFLPQFVDPSFDFLLPPATR